MKQTIMLSLWKAYRDGLSLLDRKASLSTLSGFKEFLISVTMFPALLNSLSDGELVAGIARYFLDI